MIYEKATAELVLFDNFDVITTSGLEGSNLGGGSDCKNKGHGSSTGGGGCKNNGQDNGNGCKGNSGACQGHGWK